MNSMDKYQHIRDGVRSVCAEFGNEYFRKVDEDRGYGNGLTVKPILNYADQCSRRFSNLPVGRRGSSSTNSTLRGHLNLASRRWQ